MFSSIQRLEDPDPGLDVDGMLSAIAEKRHMPDCCAQAADAVLAVFVRAVHEHPELFQECVNQKIDVLERALQCFGMTLADYGVRRRAIFVYIRRRCVPN